MDVGDRVRLRGTGQTGEIKRIAQRTDRPLYYVEFDRPAEMAETARPADPGADQAADGGLYDPEDLEASP